MKRPRSRGDPYRLSGTPNRSFNSRGASTRSSSGDFLSLIESAAGSLRGAEVRTALIIHHGDADGICAAGIVKAALERMDWEAGTACLEKLFPEVLERIHAKAVDVLAYVDLGSPHVGRISDINRGRRRVVVIDHHDPRSVDDPTLTHLNPELSGLSGESEACSSTIAYLLAKSLDAANSDLAPAALVGSAELPGKISELNRIPLRDGEENGVAKVTSTKRGESIKVKTGDSWWGRERASSLLTALGSVGYYRGGPRLALDAIERGITNEVKESAERWELERRSKFNELFSRLRASGLRKTRRTQFVDVSDMLKGMGTKVIGTCLSIMRFKRFTDPNKYLLGFMLVEPEIPGLGSITRDWTKVSARVPPKLAQAISSGSTPPVSSLLSEAAERVGGFGDGHAFAASGIIPKVSQEAFLGRADEIACGPKRAR